MEFKGKRILVTGGAGFIGSNLVNRLVKLDAEVTVLDNLFTGRKDNIEQLSRVRFFENSVENLKLVERLVYESWITFHLAVRNIIVSATEPELDFKTNVEGTFNVLMAAKKYQVDRLIFVSSASIYGNAYSFPTNEVALPQALTPYAAGKISMESYHSAFYEMYNLPVVILRYSNVYGTNQSPTNPYCGVVSKFFKNAMSGRPLHIHGDGEQTRDFTYVDDVVEATLSAATNPKAIGEKLNIGSGVETSINKLAAMINGIAGGEEPPVYEEPRSIDSINRRVLNIEKTRHILRWFPQTSLQKGLQKTHHWLQENNVTQKVQARVNV
jgi:UDP-glucose 4-epimerase